MFCLRRISGAHSKCKWLRVRPGNEGGLGIWWPAPLPRSMQACVFLSGGDAGELVEVVGKSFGGAAGVVDGHGHARARHQREAHGHAVIVVPAGK